MFENVLHFQFLVVFAIAMQNNVNKEFYEQFLLRTRKKKLPYEQRQR